MRRRNTITAAVFLLAVAAGFVLLAASFFGGEGKFETLLKGFVRDKDVMAFVDGAESAVNQDLDREHWFIQLYGGVQRLSGRRIVEDAVSENTVARLSTGALNFVDLDTRVQVGPQVKENADNTADFARALGELGIPYLYLCAPQKLQRGVQLLPEPLAESGNASADALLAELARRETDYLDLRPLFESNGIYANWFFRTDHHWKPEAAFFAWQELTEVLADRYGFPADPALTDPASWRTEVLEDFFLGSQGKRVGSLYAGADDFTVYTPKFDTSFTYTIPALDTVGKGFEQGTIFLPQLLMSAEAAGAAFDYLKEEMRRAGTAEEKKGKIVIATVKGDIHDIGKNIVRVLLENYGFEVIDLGKDVPPETVVETVLREDVKLVGLSALMTTTVPSMAETIRQLRAAAPDCKVVVGGAVMTQEYADQIGADCYSPDAMGTVYFAQKCFENAVKE